MAKLKKIVEILEKLTGKPVDASFTDDKNYQEFKDKLQSGDFIRRNPLGYSQFNELLLTLGYARVTPAFFKFLFDNKGEITDFEKLEQGVSKFRKTALLLYGNIKYAFKRLSQMDEETFEKEIKPLKPLDQSQYTKRHKPLHELTNIPHDKAYYLGYIIEKELKNKLKEDPNCKQLLEQKEEMEKYRKIGLENHQSYLVSDHMDVYIATSMRERYEFLQVSSFVQKLFDDPLLKPLNLRYFDPTQAYCKDRIDKGLVEGLMIKRARCTIYHIQESDTFGKDSELAATLAQGKPVIAYIPQIPELRIFTENTKEQVKQSDPDSPTGKALLKRLQRYYPEGAWENHEIREWIMKPETAKIDEIIALIHEKVSKIYESRATTLRETHPLGLQVNLSTGVANGVLVVRTVAECAQLLRDILLNDMRFELKEGDNDNNYLYLKECLSESIYRVATGDNFLINAFWNFYLKNNTP